MTKSFIRHAVFLPALMLAVAAPVAARAQEQPFEPIMAIFTGKTSLLLPPMPALDINGFGTIEFWAAARWDDDPGYDPAIIAYSGAQGPRFAAVITADKQKLGVYAGSDYATVPFDFSDGEKHYVALTTIGDEITVMIDGEQQAVLDFGFADVPADRFSIGSLGDYSPFIGDIGQVRIWGEPIDPDTLIDFSWKAIAADGPNAHPDIEALVGTSAFANPDTGGFVFVGEPDDPAVAQASTAPFDESKLEFGEPEPEADGK